MSNADSVKWFSPTEEIEDCEEFQMTKSGPKDREVHTLVFGEVYPDDAGEYRVEISRGSEIMTQTAALNGKNRQFYTQK